MADVRDQQRRIRNICVIAHVDHGKTTLSDSLLARAKLMNSRNAGVARELDNDDQERERGITINSTGVSLNFEDWVLRSPASAPVAAAAASESTDSNRTLYLGNLPWPANGISQDDLGKFQAGLEEQVSDAIATLGGVLDGPLHLSVKRGHGTATLIGTAQAVVSAAAAKPVVIDSRTIVVEAQGASSLQRLAAHCEANGLGSPSFKVDGDTLVLTITGKDKPLVLKASTAQRPLKEVKRELADQALAKMQPSTSPLPAAQDAVPGMLVNLIDSPGHVDFSGEVSAALRLCDGALVVVDPFDSKSLHQLCPQTEAVLRQALAESVRPVLFLNKIDKGLLSLQLEPEELYQRLAATIEVVNGVIETFQPEGRDFTVNPADGTVLFGSGLQGWALSLQVLAEQVAKKTGKTPQQVSKFWWGDRFYDSENRKWVRQAYTSDGRQLERGFVSKILKPLYALFDAAKLGDVQEMTTVAAKLGVSLRASEKELAPMPLLNVCMKGWLPAADTILHAVDVHIPSPIEAQAYRVPKLYEGPIEDVYARAMSKCDPDGPVMVYVSKLVNLDGLRGAAKGGGRKGLVAYGRVLSGTINVGDTLNILGADYEPGSKRDRYEGRVAGLVCLMGSRQVPRHASFAGELIGILGVDRFISKSATLTSGDDAHRLKVMRFIASPVVRVAVEAADAKSPGDLQKLQAGLRSLAQSDPTIEFTIDDQTGENIMAGAGELHLEVRIKTLSDMTGVRVRAKDPVVKYCESVSTVGEACLAKSSNKHNRLYLQSEPLDDDLVSALEAGSISVAADKARVDDFAEHGWSRDAAKKIVAIQGSCVLVNQVVGQDISPIIDGIINGFRLFCSRGSLANENVRGVRFNIVDCKLHADGVHRRADQIEPMCRRAFNAAFLASEPQLLEPVFLVDVQVDATYIRDCCSVLKRRRGEITADNVLEGSNVHQLQAFLPVADSFGFNGELRGASSGRAIPSCAFSHWQVVDGDPRDTSDRAGSTVESIRLYKGLAASPPALSDFADRL